MNRDRKALVALKRQDVDDTFYAADAELQEAEQEVAREFGLALEHEDDGN